MDAIFQYPMDYMNEPLNRFDSYMERASLQLKVELEEYVESTLTTSGSTFITESSETFFEKFKRGIQLVIEKLKEFINDAKMNFQKRKTDKSTEKRIDRLSSVIKKSDKLASKKVDYKDYSKKASFISQKKDELKKLFRKSSTTKEDIKKFIEDYKKELSASDKVKIAVISVTLLVAASKGFYDGLCEGYRKATALIDKDVSDLESIRKDDVFKESEEVTKSYITESAEMMALYTKAIADMCTDEIIVQREIIMEYEKTLSEIEKVVDSYLDEMGWD